MRELAQTPLLLALLCIGFEETMGFSARRDEVYREAFEALLKKWDTSRNIKRDEIYRGLSLRLKERLFARVAAEHFQQGKIFFEQDDLAREIEKFLGTLPSADKAADVDGNVVIKAIEAQHGIFVERARGIYSFSHLTFQEYFTARYIVENAARGAFKGLLGRITDPRWREVFLLTASMLDQESADEFFLEFRRGIDALIADDEKQIAFCKWAMGKAKDYEKEMGYLAVARALAQGMAGYTRILDRIARNRGGYIQDFTLESNLALAQNLAITNYLSFDRSLDNHLSLDQSLAFAFDLDLAQNLTRDPVLKRDLNLANTLSRLRGFAFVFTIDSDFARTSAVLQKHFFNLMFSGTEKQVEDDLNEDLKSLHLPYDESNEAEWKAFVEQLQAIMIRYRNIGHDWGFTEEQGKQLDEYENATVLLAECLKVAQVSNRKKIEDSLLMPPEEWEGW